MTPEAEQPVLLPVPPALPNAPDEQPGAKRNPNEYTLTADEKGMLDEITAQIQQLQGEAQSVLRGIMRFRKLTGDGWTLNGDKLTRAEAK